MQLTKPEGRRTALLSLHLNALAQLKVETTSTTSLWICIYCSAHTHLHLVTNHCWHRPHHSGSLSPSPKHGACLVIFKKCTPIWKRKQNTDNRPPRVLRNFRWIIYLFLCTALNPFSKCRTKSTVNYAYHLSQSRKIIKRGDRSSSLENLTLEKSKNYIYIAL